MPSDTVLKGEGKCNQKERDVRVFQAGGAASVNRVTKPHGCEGTVSMYTEVKGEDKADKRGLG